MANPIVAVRVYFVGESDALDAFVMNPPFPWRVVTEGVRCTVGVGNSAELTEANVVTFETGMTGPNVLPDFNAGLRDRLKDSGVQWWTVEDAASISAELDALRHIEQGWRKRGRE